MPANLSIRNARFEYRSRFTQAITDYRAVCDLYAHARVPEEISQTLLSRLPADVLRRVVRHLVGSLSQADALLGIASPLRPPPAVKFEVCVRVRPLWSTEAEDGEYDAISIDEDVGRCCVHDGKAARDMSTYTLHREFALDRTFGANTDEGAMHSQVVGPLLQRVLQRITLRLRLKSDLRHDALSTAGQTWLVRFIGTRGGGGPFCGILLLPPAERVGSLSILLVRCREWSSRRHSGSLLFFVSVGVASFM